MKTKTKTTIQPKKLYTAVVLVYHIILVGPSPVNGVVGELGAELVVLGGKDMDVRAVAVAEGARVLLGGCAEAR